MSPIDELYKSRQTIQPIDIAIVCHEANRAYCQSMGDYSQKSWSTSPEWQRTSILMGVLELLKDPDRTPRQSHEGWLAHKMAEGWVYGEFKDPENKTHPCCVPYDQLAPGQKIKDTLFCAIVRALAPMLEQPACPSTTASTSKVASSA